MKAVILAGGLGSRIVEETHLIPKPMIEIGGKPILWHILKMYSSHNINEFIICCGYKGYVIKEYFANYFLHMSDVTFDMSNNSVTVHQQNAEPWSVTLVDTGENSMTGGRLRRVREFVRNDEAFCFTYGDGLSDLNITALVKFHNAHGRLATVTATRPPGRYGALQLGKSAAVTRFEEKPLGDSGWINGGFFVLSPKVLNKLDKFDSVWEQTPLKSLADDGELMAFEHRGFWQPMDTLRDKMLLEELWDKHKAPWKIW